MYIFKTYLLLILFALPLCGETQTNSENNPHGAASYNLYTFYPDSILKGGIYQYKNDLLHGCAIEFDENGLPQGIGRYKNNIKKGKWRYADCTIIRYKNKTHEVYTPPYCGISDLRLMKKFYALVNKHLDQEIYYP